MQQYTLDGLHATFREREQRALNAAHRYRQAKQAQQIQAAQRPVPAASTVTGRRRFAIHVPRPIRMWLLSVLLLTSACGGADAAPHDPSSETPLVYQDCFRGTPPQIC